MKKTIFVILVFFAVLTGTLSAEQIVLSVSDFKVESNNPSHEFIGKGLSRLVAGELRKSGQIMLLEREQMKKILEEQEFSLSDLADAAKQIQIGKMLSTEYIVFGEVIDMGKTLLLSLRMADVETGEIIWQEEITEKLTTYDYIGAYFAGSIITELREKVGGTIEVESTTIEKIEKKEEKKEEAIVKLSEGIDAFDRNDLETAKQVLEDVKKIDPVSEVADYYLAKIIINTTKFKVQSEAYYSYQNPAYLGIIRTDKIFINLSTGLLNVMWAKALEYLNSIYLPEYNVSVVEYDARMRLGYSFPLGDNFGMQAEAMYFTIWDTAWDTVMHGKEEYPWGSSEGVAGGGNTVRIGPGGIISCGYKILDSISVGLGAAIYIIMPVGEKKASTNFAINAGMLYRNSNESFIFDTRIGYGTEKYYTINVETLAEENEVGVPLFNENTFTFAFNRKNTFIIVKQINEISINRTYYFGRILPAFEHYFTDWFSLRGGIEGSYALLNDTHNFGFGILCGTTFRVRDFDLDLNITYRLRPSRMVEEEMHPDFIALVNLSWNDVFRSRE